MGSACCTPVKQWESERTGTNWQMNGNFSPGNNGMHLYRSSFSSSSRRSSRFASHHRSLSPDPSPSGSFRANPLGSSQICPLAEECIPSSCMTVSSSKEGCLSGGLSTVSNTPESTTSSLVTNSSNLSKLSKSQREKPLTESGPDTSDWWSMLTFSELVASSRRWMSDELSGLDDLTLERIKAGSASPIPDALVCGLCFRRLSQRSPLTPQRTLGNIDLPGVGVLACGHVFHADCLEHATSASEQQDPPCPQCSSSSRIKLFPHILGRNKSKRDSDIWFKKKSAELCSTEASTKGRQKKNSHLRSKKVSPDNGDDGSFRYFKRW